MNENKNQRRDDRRPSAPLAWEDAAQTSTTMHVDRDTVQAAPIRAWRERLGLPADFPLHVPSNVEWAMEAEIAELRAQFVPPAAKLVRIGGLMANVMYNLAQQAGKPLGAHDCEIMDSLRKAWDQARAASPVDNRQQKET